MLSTTWRRLYRYSVCAQGGEGGDSVLAPAQKMACSALLSFRITIFLSAVATSCDVGRVNLTHRCGALPALLWLQTIEIERCGIVGGFPRGLAQCKHLSTIKLTFDELGGEVPTDFWLL